MAALPKAPFEVVPVPDYMAKSAPPAYYEAGTPDGSRPGRLMINTYNAADRNRYAMEAIAYHEGIPGHHLQLSIAQEQTDVPTFRKFGEYTAFVEGWGPLLRAPGQGRWVLSGSVLGLWAA